MNQLSKPIRQVIIDGRKQEVNDTVVIYEKTGIKYDATLRTHDKRILDAINKGKDIEIVTSNKIFKLKYENMDKIYVLNEPTDFHI